MCCTVCSAVCCVVSHLEIFFPYASSVHTFFIIEDHLHIEKQREQVTGELVRARSTVCGQRCS